MTAKRKEYEIEPEAVEIDLETPIVPKKNSYQAGMTKGGRMYSYRSKRARDSEMALKIEASWKLRVKGIKAPRDGPVAVSVEFQKTRADAIGLLETLLDALEGIAYLNDRQVIDGHYRYAPDLKGGRVTARVIIIYLSEG